MLRVAVRIADGKLRWRPRQIAVDRAAARARCRAPGRWTSQNGDAGNTLVSAESHVKAPLGLLWFGGPSNREVLPRHGHGPIPQVIGGRLFIEGRDMLRAVDVYTGRLLWQREFKDVGIFYDNTDHHPGAGAIGGNYVCTSDSVYLAWGRRCLRLDPATGDDARRVLAAAGRVRCSSRTGATSPCRATILWPAVRRCCCWPAHRARSSTRTTRSNSNAKCRCSPRLAKAVAAWWCMDRFDGHVHWTRDAQYNFRHNAIAIGDGKVFCLDRMTEQRLAHFRRRGQVPVADFCLYALDLADRRRRLAIDRARVWDVVGIQRGDRALAAGRQQEPGSCRG